MVASLTNPLYKVNIIKADGTKYQLQEATTDLVVSHAEKELAEKVNLSVVNVKVGTKRLHYLLELKDNVYVYADTGNGYQEVFRGFLWERSLSRSANTNEISLVCYDRLKYFHESKDDVYYKKGKKTEDVISDIAKKWGFTISYKYKSITHSKLVYRQESIADIITDILNLVKKSTGIDYVIRMEKNVIVIDAVGTNSTVYKIESNSNAIEVSHTQSMDSMVTKVKIVKAETDKSGETGKYLTVTSVSKNTDKYGTLQDILVKSKDDKLSDIKNEANQILKDYAQPKLTIEVKAIDNPHIKKGDKVYIATGNLKNYYIVKGIEHDCSDKTMYLEVKRYE